MNKKDVSKKTEIQNLTKSIFLIFFLVDFIEVFIILFSVFLGFCISLNGPFSL